MEADNAKAIWVCSSRLLRIKKSNSHCQLKRLHKSFNNVCTKNAQIYQTTNPYRCLYRNLVQLQLGVVQAYMQPLPCTGLPGSCVLRKIIESPMLLPCEIQGARHTTNFCLTTFNQPTSASQSCTILFPLKRFYCIQDLHDQVFLPDRLQYCGIATLFGKCHTIISLRDPMGAKKEKKTYYKTYVHFTIIRAKI